MDMDLLYAINDALTAICNDRGIDICDEHLNDATHAAGSALTACKGVGNECGDHGENEPTCDICNRGQCFTPEMEWNGETGNHVECETLQVGGK